MIVLYNGCHTSFDVMKEYMIYGAELDEKYQIPIVPACSLDYLPEDSIDFGESFSQKIKGHRKLNVNFYIDDSKFQRLWNNPDKYMEHLNCFHSVCMPDFSIATGDCGMPFALNLYNVYRNHALAHYMLLNGIRVIPSVGIPDKDNYDLCFAGYSKGGVIAVDHDTSNGETMEAWKCDSTGAALDEDTPSFRVKEINDPVSYDEDGEPDQWELVGFEIE